jgi:endoglucanase Acf2
MKNNFKNWQMAGKGKFLSLLIIILSVCMYLNGQSVVTVGSGSYASYPPTHEMDGVFTTFAQSADINVAPGETRPIPTNEWWTNIIYDEGSELGGRLWAMPLVADPFESGLNIYHPTKWNTTGTDLMIDYPVVLKGDGFVPTRSIATDWSDWSVDVKTYQDINNKYILTKSVHGSPFIWVNVVGFTPQIECYHNGQYLNSSGGAITFPFTGEYFVILYWDTYYGVHLPPGSTVTKGGTTGNLLTITLGSGANYIVFSALPNAATAATLHQYAYVKPTSTSVSWSYNTTAGTMAATWALTTTNIRGAAVNTAVQGFLPHQYRSATSSNVAYNGITYKQSRGLLRMATGNSYTFNYKFNGILPSFTAPATRAADANPYNASVMSSIITAYANKLRAATPPPYASDTYWGGKDIVRMAKMMLFAKETNHAEYTYLMTTLKAAMTNWLTYTPGETEFYFAWYPKWKALIGFNESYYSGLFTDNHFHYGYIIQAAALLAMADYNYVNQYNGILTMIAKQYANWDKADGNFPFMRTFDPWMGHSYAGGVSSPNGNNQESTSEAMQSWHALYFLGSALGNNAMRDAGAFGYLSESKATLEYWFNRNGDVWPAAYNHSVVGILWPGGYVYGTYFGIDPQWIHGIQMLPISPAFHYFNQGFTTAQAATYYNNLNTEMYNYYVGNGNTAITDGGVATESEVGDWGHVLLGFRSLFEPTYSTQKMAAAWNSASGTDEYNFMHDNQEAGQTYYYAHALQNLGLIQMDYNMSIPTSATYYNSTTGVTTYVVWNPSASAQTCVVYRNGTQVTSFSVPARTLYNSNATVNPPPTVSITSPANNSTYIAPATIVISATAADANGTVTQVAFYNGSTLLGTDATSPYSYTWSNVAGGTYSITAVATDNGGSSTTSAAITVIVNGGSNLALNKPTTVSSTENAGTPGSAAVDGNAGTRWSSAASDPQWIYVDLGATYNVNRVKITWETAYASAYQIQYSTNASTWTTIKTVTGNTTLTNDNTGLSGSARYVRIYGTARATGWGYSIWELEVYGTSGIPPTVSITAPANGASYTAPASVTINANAADADGTVTQVAFYNGSTLLGTDATSPYSYTWSNVAAGSYSITARATDNAGLTTTSAAVAITVGGGTNLALNKTTTVSSIEAAGTPGSAAVDGNAGTRWSSAFSDPQWIYVDLGASYTISRVKITWEGAYATAYQIQVSTNATTWTTIKTVTGNTTLINDNTGLSGTGRYVRIYGTTRATVWGYSIYELEVYGAAKSATEVSDLESPSALSIYPVPFNNLLNIEGNNDIKQVTIYDLSGRVCIDKLCNNEAFTTINVENLKKGVYMVRVKVGNEVILKKVVK